MGAIFEGLQWEQIFFEEQLTMAPDLHFHTDASGILGYEGVIIISIGSRRLES